ncbi:glycosyltransferase family 2 protein [Aureitalea sp. L0-47]|uniref:glycosyltransferase family 2 protein n=1 Tax=Aureitalea sp. L0-47 TaxID=2816962 RepID=UPI0022378634|nr:glycosyltransferase family 2 protein [Aureitalea sp. L0-47]MCW5520337.1 glycosyltransferase family 2 protein [Aureitalea sp. L0-47]
MKDQIPISALAITLNEEKNIDGFIKSLWFADEIVIVDSFSKDETVARASSYPNVTVHQRKFDNFSSQKNFAISKAANDWVVFFDLDEEITKPLSEEITTTIQKSSASAFYVKRDFYFMGKRIKYSGLQNDWVVRVFNKENCRYNDNLVHEVLDVNGSTAKLKSRVPHYTYQGIDDYTAKMHRYSALQAKMLYDQGKRPTLMHFFFRPLYRFWHQYLIRLGILDGKEGFILAYINGFSVFKRYVNLWLLYRKIN